MAISFIPSQIKPEFISEIKKDKTLWLFIGTILLLLVIFIGLKIYNTQMKGQISILEEKIQKLDEEKDKKLEKEMREKIPLLEKTKVVLNSHTKAKNIFDLLEKKTFSEVQITSFSFNAQDNTIIISAESDNDKALAMQTSIFRATPEIKSVEVGGISKVEDLFKFQFKLTLGEKVIKFSYKIK